jgi:hypothetical protein
MRKDPPKRPPKAVERGKVLESREMRPEIGIVEVRSCVGHQSFNNKEKSRCDRRSRPIGKGCNPMRVSLKSKEEPVNTLLSYT